MSEVKTGMHRILDQPGVCASWINLLNRSGTSSGEGIEFDFLRLSRSQIGRRFE
jgi:hypothetical protein